MKLVTVKYAIQTNGTLINEEGCHFLVGLSSDGGVKFHNDNRMDAKGQGIFSNVMTTKRLFDHFENYVS